MLNFNYRWDESILPCKGMCFFFLYGNFCIKLSMIINCTPKTFYTSTRTNQNQNHNALWSSLSFQFRQRTKLWNQSPVWSHLFTVGSGCWLMDILTESPLNNCCLLLPSKETQALLLASSGIWNGTHTKQAIKNAEILEGFLKISKNFQAKLEKS